MKITKRQLKRIIKEYHPRPDDDDGYPDDDEDDAAYDQGYDDGFNGYPSNPVVGGDYHVGYEEGVNAAKDEASREDDPEEFGPHSPGMMGPPRREGKMRISKRQLRRIIKEEMRLAGGMGNVPVPDPDLYDLGYDDGSAFEKPDRDWANNASYMKGYEDGQMERDGGRR
jgi:hypothetical protein